VPKFDRYMLSQLTVLFGFFALVLVSVYWVNRAVALFDQLIGDGQSALVFLEFTALALPNVIRLVLPVAAFAAAVYVTNRMMAESELVVVQATGFSAFRLARPVFLFGLVVAILVAVMNHFLVPASRGQLAQRQAEIAQDVTARFLSEGRFLHPAEGVTFYIRQITPEGEMRDIFLSDARSKMRRVTYTARRALLVPGKDGPQLVMFDGMAQTLELDGQRLSTTRFRDSVFDVAALIRNRQAPGPTVDVLSTPQLLSLDPALLAETGAPPAIFLYEAHARIAQPFLAVAAPLIGFAALMLGGFSRFGTWRQVILAMVLLIGVQFLDNAMADIARQDRDLWPVVYLPALLGILLAGAMLWASSRPDLMRPRRRGPATGGTA